MNPNPTIDPDRQAQARVYARLRRRAWAARSLIGAAYLGIWIGLGGAQAVHGALSDSWMAGQRASGIPWWLTLAAIALSIGVPWLAVMLPLDFYSGFLLPKRFGLSTQSPQGWGMDWIKGAGVSALAGLPLLFGLYLLLRLSPRMWWLWAGLGTTLLNAVLTVLSPLTLIPLFFKIRPLGDDHAELAQRLIRLAERAGTRVKGAFAFDMSRRTRSANAMLLGLGATRRILLGDTLLSEFSEDEIETVLAHELAHHVHGDIPRGILAGGLVALGACFLAGQVMSRLGPLQGLTDLSNPAGLPTWALVLGMTSLLLSPLWNAYARWRESAADAFAIQLTGKSRAFSSAMARLATQNLADVDPERWEVILFHGHPPLGERIRKARDLHQGGA
jgi:STE24 endopeptidase